MKLRLTILAAALLLGPSCEGGSGGAAGPGGPGGPPGGRRQAREALLVETTTLEPATIERYYQTSGTLQALREAELYALQLGIIKSIAVEEGDVVEKNDALLKLDGRELTLQSDAAKVQLQNLRTELKRLQGAKGGVVPQEEIDNQRYAVEEAEAALKLSKFQAKQTWVRAPFRGTIVERMVDEGNLATTSTALFKIADLEALELELHVPEKDAASVADDATVEITLVDDSVATASIERRSPVVDPLTGTVKFTVRAESFPAAAKPGAFARAKVLVTRSKDAPSLPRTAVFEVEGKPHVYVLADGRAKRTEVETGLEGDARVEILEGLAPQDVVVAGGGAGITEGMPLRSANDKPRTAADTSDPERPAPERPDQVG
ncbi:MAG: efflux RND transporter periplasmic adaptor subunit [Nannocystaceae bacterium]|nr:efflux RND transporter periplasmic adaptor subunit [bacterium]